MRYIATSGPEQDFPLVLKYDLVATLLLCAELADG